MLLALVLIGCADPKTGDTDTDTAPVDSGADVVDVDEDGISPPTDCDDTNEYVYPGAPEVPYDGIDQDCNGADVTDSDGDGYDGTGGGGDDCNDGNPNINPGIKEICYNGLDDDCSGGEDTGYDCDEDGYARAEDCDDEDAAVNPGAEDTWYDGVDANCDRADDYDQDADGHATPAGGGTDCDDLEPTVNEDADEIWDGLDNDCDGGVDVLSSYDWTATWRSDGADTETSFGLGFATSSDVSGDGIRDAVIGVPGTHESNGRVYVVAWGEGSRDAGAEALATIEGNDTIELGMSVLSADDGSGGQLLVVGAPDQAGLVNGGGLYVFASASGALTTADASALVTFPYAGGGLAEWQDGDGPGRVVVSSYGVAATGSTVAMYAVESLSAGADLALTDSVWTFSGTGDFYDMGLAGDLDGDGLSELGIGNAGYSDAPRAAIATGPDLLGGVSEGLPATTGFVGAMVLGGLSDVDGDGLDEWLISDTTADGDATAAGVVYVVAGADALVGGVVGNIAHATVTGDLENGNMRAASTHGDLDGDGVPDLLVCSPGDNVNPVTGWCRYVSGTDIATGGTLAPTAGTPSFDSNRSDDVFGWDAWVEDIDADGDADLWLHSLGENGSILGYRRD